MVKEEVKKLTQAQKNYLVKRINDIANAKIGKLGGTANYGSQQCRNYNGNAFVAHGLKHKLDAVSVQAIVDGEVRLRSKVSLMTCLKERVADELSYFKVDLMDFIDPKSLEKFNIARDKKAKATYEDTHKRVSSIKDEADNLKDSVMLEGSLAIELLDKFEKKEF